jgi:hypothetical protein
VADHLCGGAADDKTANHRETIGPHDNEINLLLRAVVAQRLPDLALNDCRGYVKAFNLKVVLRSSELALLIGGRLA